MAFPEQNNLEIWKPIPRYENYEISSWGRVKRIKPGGCDEKGIIMKTSEKKRGYEQVGLSIKGVTIVKTIHKLVAITFLPNPNNYPEINHIDGNKKNNKLENLEWTSSSQNQKHAYQIGLKKSLKGENHSNSKLTEIQLLEIRRLISEGWKQIDIAKKFNVHKTLISQIVNKKAWTHI